MRAAPHHRDPVGERQRLLLVVGDIERGDAEPVDQRAQLAAQLHPDAGIERRHRLVEQQHFGIGGERAGQRDALLLAAGKLVRIAPGEMVDLDEVRQLVDAPLARGARRR